jgi:hypothetical protein
MPYSQFLLVALAATLAIGAEKNTWDGSYGSADAACRAKHAGEGAYQFHRADVKGNIAHCYEKAKDGEGDEIYYSAVSKDEGPEEEAKPADSKDGNSNATPPTNPGAGSGGGKPKDEFASKCIPFPSNEWNTELDAAYKAPVSGSGGAGAGMFDAQNAAVLEWNEGGSRKTQWFTSGDGHTEKHILTYLKDKKIPRENVTRIYSELSPCIAQCLPALSKHFEGMKSKVTIEFSWFHGTGKQYQGCNHGNATQDRKTQKKERRDRVSAGG